MSYIELSPSAAGGGTAATTTFTPAGNVAATDVQAAIVELDTEKAPVSHSHPQSEVTNLVSDLALKAPLASPVFTGDPQAPTPTAGDSDTSIATTGFVTNAVAAIGPGGMSTAEYTYSTTTTAPPSTGQLRGNNTTQSAITAFYLHESNAVGIDITNALKIIAAGVKILVQDKTNAANVQYYTTSGPAVDNGAYFTIPVTWTSTGSGTPFTAGRVIFAGFGIGSNNMPEAPTDGAIYGRRGSDASWQAVTKKNYIINGAMMVSQENGTTVGTTDAYYPVDAFIVEKGGAVTGAFTIQQELAASAPSLAGGGQIRLAITTADAAVAANDFLLIATRLEGARVTDLGFGTARAKTITLQFSVSAPAGTYSVTIANASTPTRSYVAEYVVAAGEANTPVVKSVTIPGDTTGTWAKDNTLGMMVRWGFMAGTTFQQAAGSWGTGNAIGSPSQFNFMGTMGNVFELSDVSLTEGSVAPPFVVPDYASELTACQRYYQKFYSPPGSGVSVGSTLIHGWSFPLPVEMRAVPTALISGAINFTTDVQGFTITGVSSSSCQPTSWHIVGIASAVVATGKTAVVQGTPAPNFISVNARL